MNPMDRIERQFAQVFPVKPAPAPFCGYCDGTGQIETDNNGPIGPCPICKPDRLRELQSDLHIKGADQ